MSERKVETSGQGMFAKEVTITRSESPKQTKDIQRKRNTERTNSFATENILRHNYEQDKKKGMSKNDLIAKYRKF